VNSVAPTIVCDTNSLWNFAVVGRLDIIETRYGHRITWTDSVADEVRRASGRDLALVDVLSCAWLGEPHEFDDDCMSDVFAIRRILAAQDDPLTKHLGEAECIHFIEHEMTGNGILLTDDHAAADLAKRRGIAVLDTLAVMQDAFGMGELSCPEPYELLVKMADEHDRTGVVVPKSHKDVC
jgi:predicted nucleic acid-binding protein